MSISSRTSLRKHKRRPARLLDDLDAADALDILNSFPQPPSTRSPSSSSFSSAAGPSSAHLMGPPLSLPPTSPLPPVPGPSPVAQSTLNDFRRRSARISMVESLAELLEMEGAISGKSVLQDLKEVETRGSSSLPSSSRRAHASAQGRVHSQSSIETDSVNPVHKRNSINFPSGIAAPVVTPKRKTSHPQLGSRTTRQSAPSASGHPRSTSPDLNILMTTTPRPRLAHSSSRLSNGALASSSSGSNSSARPLSMDDDEDYGAPLDDALIDDGSASDSSIDLHTPLPHLMLRHGLLSPQSKLLPEAARLKSRVLLSKKELKDQRDTAQRRVRHRDGKQLRAGMGLTTGLGWSDSEDEDAPSPLTRRLSKLNLSRSRTSSVYSMNSAYTQHGLRSVASAASLRSASSRAKIPPTAWSGNPRSPSQTHTRPLSADSSSTALTSTSSVRTATIDLDKGLPPLPRHTLSLRRKTITDTPNTTRRVSDSLTSNEFGVIKSNEREPARAAPATIAYSPQSQAISRSRARTISGGSVLSTKAVAGHAMTEVAPPLPTPEAMDASARKFTQVKPSTSTAPTAYQSVLKYNRNTAPSSVPSLSRSSSPVDPRSSTWMRGPLTRSSTTPTVGDDGIRPAIGSPRPLMPRTGTGMVYRSPSASHHGFRALKTANLSATPVPPSGNAIGVAL